MKNIRKVISVFLMVLVLAAFPVAAAAAGDDPIPETTAAAETAPAAENAEEAVEETAPVADEGMEAQITAMEEQLNTLPQQAEKLTELEKRVEELESGNQNLQYQLIAQAESLKSYKLYFFVSVGVGIVALLAAIIAAIMAARDSDRRNLEILQNNVQTLSADVHTLKTNTAQTMMLHEKKLSAMENKMQGSL